MCGIFALLNNHDEILPNTIDMAINKAKHRGPENTTIINKQGYVFGFHRLAINGIDPISNQPFDINNCLLMCNGEIYNHKKLFNLLNIKPSTNSDCEIIIHLYRKYGIDTTLQMLDGVFSFILYDKVNEFMIIARDPYGVRPLFKLDSLGDIYAYASELKQLYPLKLVINNYVMIKQFSPGHYEILKKRQPHDSQIIECALENKQFELLYKKKYTEFCFYKMPIYNNWEPYFDLIRRELENAVMKRVETTERPIACLLSGGLDSSLVTSLVKKYYTGTLETYSIGLKDAEDLKYAQKVADFLGTKHTEIIVSEDDFFNAIPEVIEKIESYDTTTVRASVGNYLIGKYISENSEAKVIFNGDGSDELAGGYLYMHYAPNALEFDIECKRLLKHICFFDVLRSDRSISTNGLEPRTPFLDRGWVEAYLSIPNEIRFHKLHKHPEKYLIRKAFDNGGYLPDEVLWRTKEAFSDGVSNKNRSWFEIIQEKVNKKTIDLQGFNKYLLNEVTNIHNPPTTLEQSYYRKIFKNNYDMCDDVIPYFWMPNFIKAKDASARTLNIYN